MATKNKPKPKHDNIKKKTSIGNSKFTKRHSKGGGPNGSTIGKHYKKSNRGQGKKR